MWVLCCSKLPLIYTANIYKSYWLYCFRLLIINNNQSRWSWVIQPQSNNTAHQQSSYNKVNWSWQLISACDYFFLQLKVDCQFVDFGSHVVGQTISRTITLTNKGALATRFSLDTSTCHVPETSHVQMPSQIYANTRQVSLPTGSLIPEVCFNVITTLNADLACINLHHHV